VGKAGEYGQRDEEGPVREWLSYLRTLRRRHGGLTEQEIATRMGLTARSRVSHLLNHAPPRSRVQAGELLDALEAFEWEKENALNLWELAKNEHFGDDPSRSRRAGDRREPSPQFAEVARSDVPTGGLRGRARELGELAAFCADEERTYIWWQAEAWAGKTALLASFVVVDHPPGIVPVSFFITGRQAGLDTSLAFLRDVTAQLEALSGTSQPEVIIHDGVPYLHWLLRECAQLVSKDAQRLVLVVDGLDEDMSRAVDRRSIASMLPKNLDHGSKVIVSGRPNPRLPGDMPADHPLWNPDIVRVLSVSQHAIARRDLAAAELNQLLDSGSDLAGDMVGYLVAARGGLTAKDIAELTRRQRRDVDKILNSAIGRTFAPRPVITARVEEDPGLIFSHDMLSAEAQSQLGEAQVRAYRDKLHEWAEGYRDRRWPPETPFYLLRGYGEMLAQQHDFTRLVALAADGTRVDRILEVTGSDADAITEVGAAISSLVAQRSADLAGLALLAYQRDRIADRNGALPARLPAAWARAGQPVRAEALARSLAGELSVQALAWTGIAFAEAGEEEAAGRLAAMACDGLRQLPGYSGAHPAPAGAVAAALACTGQSARAREILDSIENPWARDRQLAQVVTRMAMAGALMEAEETAASAQAVLFRVQATAGAAEGHAMAYRPGHAARLAGAAEELAMSIGDADERDDALTAVARAWAVTGQGERAEALAGDVSGLGARGEALAGIAAVLAAPGRGDLVAGLVGAANVLFGEAEALDGVTTSFSLLSASGDIAVAHAGIGQVSTAEDLARVPGSTGNRVDCLISIAEKLLRTGQEAEAVRILGDAENAVRGGSAVRELGAALITVSSALTAVGLTGQAANALADLGSVAAGPLHEVVPLRDLAVALAKAGEGERCADVVAAIDDPKEQDFVRAWSAVLLADAGKHHRAMDLMGGVLDLKGRTWAYPQVIAAVAAARDFEQAAALAAQLPDSRSRSRALTSIAVEHARAGQRSAALALLDQIDDKPARYEAIADIAPALAQSGQAEHALALSEIPDHRIRGQAHAKIARNLAEAGRTSQARHLAETITNLWWRASAQAWIASTVADAAVADRTQMLDELEDLLTKAQQESAEERRRTEMRDGPVVWLPRAEQSAAAWAASAAFARAGQVERAVRAAALEPHPKTSRRALEKVAVTLAASGYTEAGVNLATTTRFRSPTAEVLARVAAALADAGKTARARDLLVTAMQTGRWDSGLVTMGRISTNDLLRLAESLRSEFGAAVSARGG
jgi:hypothetical protein